MLFRKDFTEADWDRIAAAVERWLAWFRQGPKRTYSDVRTEDVIAALKADEDALILLIGGYLLVADVNPLWCKPDKVFLSERTVFRVDEQPRDFRVVPQTLLHIAASIPNCAGISVGTSFTRDNRLRRVYERYGFEVEAESLFRST